MDCHDAVAADVTWEEEEEEGSSVADAMLEEGQVGEADNGGDHNGAPHASCNDDGDGSASLRQQ